MKPGKYYSLSTKSFEEKYYNAFIKTMAKNPEYFVKKCKDDGMALSLPRLFF